MLTKSLKNMAPNAVAGSYGGSVFSFFYISELISIMAAQVYISTSSV